MRVSCISTSLETREGAKGLGSSDISTSLNQIKNRESRMEMPDSGLR
jgi:hypothetical protein